MFTCLIYAKEEFYKHDPRRKQTQKQKRDETSASDMMNVDHESTRTVDKKNN